MSQSRRSAACSLIANRVIQWPPSNSTRLVGAVRFAAQPWGGSYCSYQPGMDGPFWVVPGLGPSQHEFSRRPARAGGLKAEPDPNPRHGRHGDSGQPLLAGRGRISRRLPPLQRCHRGTQHGQALPRRSSPPPTRPTRAPRRCSSRTSCDCEGQASLPAGAKMALRRRSALWVAGEPAYRPGSVHPRERADGHPSGTAVADSLVRPTREHRTGRPQTLAQETGAYGAASLLALLRVGFT